MDGVPEVMQGSLIIRKTPKGRWKEKIRDVEKKRQGWLIRDEVYLLRFI